MNEHPVYAHFGGAKVRIGTAIADGDGSFTLQLGGLSLGPGQPASSRGGAAGASGAVFPPFGRSKGAPIHGASMQDLEFYAGAVRRSVDDPSKERWRQKNQEVLDAINAEIERQGGTVQPEGGDYGGSRRDSYGEPSYGSTRTEEDDIPF